jgi:hypothetical protein
MEGRNMKIFTKTIFFALALMLMAGLTPANLWAEPVPASHHVEPYSIDSGLLGGAGAEGDEEEAAVRFKKTIELEGAPWLRLHFSEYNLGERSYMLITSLLDGASQRLDATELEERDGVSDYFYGDTVELELHVAPGEMGIFVRMRRITVGDYQETGPESTEQGEDTPVLTGDQLPPPPPRKVPAWMPVHSVLYELFLELREEAVTTPSVEQIETSAQRGITMRPDGKVLVEIIAPEGTEIAEEIDAPGLEAEGVELGIGRSEVVVSDNADVAEIQMPLSTYENRAEAWLPLSKLQEISQALPEGYFIKEVTPLDYDDVAGQGPTVTNSDSYRDAGQNGAGLTIAVIDGGFYNLTAARTNGDAPVSTNINYTPNAFEAIGDGTHGTGCVEAAFDHAPGATWRIYKIDSVTDLGTAVTNAIAAGVDVITHSLSWYNKGWADNTGAACSAANNASNNGVVFFTSAGNRAQSHYQGSFTDADSDNWCEFSPGDETIDISIGPGSGPGGPYYLSWSNSGIDLDFYLYNPGLTAVVASSTTSGAGVFEGFSFEHSGATETYHLAVRRASGSGSNTIEIFSHNAGTWQEYIVAENSTSSPSNSTGSRVISVGAVSHGSYGQPNGSNVIASYSSRGPSNSNMTLPDLCGPTNTTGFTYPGGFGGTSAATPNAAGAACAFWSSNTLLSGYATQWLMKEQADLWRDWGTSGNDNTYGKGGVLLTDYHFGTRWMARSYGNTGNSSSAPYYTLQAAHDAVPSSGRILIFGGSYPETATLGSTGKYITVEQVTESGIILLGQ